jgi:hypothetical protein
MSGYYGEEVRYSSFHVYEMRKEILKRLERKKRLAVVITD